MHVWSFYWGQTNGHLSSLQLECTILQSFIFKRPYFIVLWIVQQTMHRLNTVLQPLGIHPTMLSHPPGGIPFQVDQLCLNLCWDPAMRNPQGLQCCFIYDTTEPLKTVGPTLQLLQCGLVEGVSCDEAWNWPTLFRQPLGDVTGQFVQFFLYSLCIRYQSSTLVGQNSIKQVPHITTVLLVALFVNSADLYAPIRSEEVLLHSGFSEHKVPCSQTYAFWTHCQNNQIPTLSMYQI